MTSFLPPSPQACDRSKTRRLKPAALARRCVGSFIVLAGLAIISSDLLARLNHAEIDAVATATTPTLAQHPAPTSR